MCYVDLVINSHAVQRYYEKLSVRYALGLAILQVAAQGRRWRWNSYRKTRWIAAGAEAVT